MTAAPPVPLPTAGRGPARPARSGAPPAAPPPSRPPGPARPLLPPALRPVWRLDGALQLGLDPVRAVVVEGVDEPLARALLELDGCRAEPEVLTAAAAAGVDARTLGRLLADLRAEGVLADVGGRAGPRAEPVPPTGSAAAARAFGTPGAAGRLGPDLASLSLLTGGGPAPLDLLRRRRASTVVVHGAGRVGASLASLLAAAGVGRVHVIDRGPVRPGDVAPAGPGAEDVDGSRAAAAAGALRRAAPEVQTGPPPPTRLPDLVVLPSLDPLDTALRAVLRDGRVTHLVLGVRETTAVVGPLVLPGHSSCLRCADLHRADRDPSWPLVAAQLGGVRRRQEEPCDVVLATVAAGLAALQCLAHLDGRPVAATSATLELALPDWRLRRRSWPPHPRCGCGADR